MGTKPLVPPDFAAPVISPQAASLFRRTPYISLREFKQTPTAISVKALVPGGTEAEQEAALAAVISRASGEADRLCFHDAAGTLAASPTVESGWVTPKPKGEVQLVCNFKPVLAVLGMQIGASAVELQSLAEPAAITIDGNVVLVPNAESLTGTQFGGPPTAQSGKVWVVWNYVNGFPHTSLAQSAAKEATQITVAPSEPGGSEVFGVWEGTQLTIHDGADTEVIVVKEVEGLTLKLQGKTEYAHTVPAKPDTIRVSAIPWDVEQAVVSLTSYLIKTRGTRAMQMSSTPGGRAGKQEEGQPGATADLKHAKALLKPYEVTLRRST